FGLDVIDVRPDPHHHAVSQQERMWETDPDLCCQVNKVQPLEEAKENFDLWISSLMRWQTDHRAGLESFEQPRGMINFNPDIRATTTCRSSGWSRRATSRLVAATAPARARAVRVAGLASKKPSVAFTCRKTACCRPAAGSSRVITTRYHCPANRISSSSGAHAFVS